MPREDGRAAAAAGSRSFRPAGLTGALLAASMWGFAGVLAALTTCSGVTVAFWRLLIGALAYAVALAATRRGLSIALLRACLPGGILFAGDIVLFFSAIKLTNIAVVSVIGALQPVVVALAARRLFGERWTGRELALMGVALGGVVLVVVGTEARSPDSLTGDLFAAAAMLCWSAYWIVSKRARDSHGSLEYTAGVTLVALVAVAPVTVFADQGLGHLTAGDWLPIVLIALVPGGGHLVMNWAHRYVAASLSSVVGSLSALVAAVAAVPVLGQPLSPVQLVGVAAAVGGVGLLAARRREQGPIGGEIRARSGGPA
ncbi:MAG TPA: DMT family transporter [Acidimicrobiales bacterium]|nr:DMT family transporter [Acidimicrobiales bacterium]